MRSSLKFTLFFISFFLLILVSSKKSINAQPIFHGAQTIGNHPHSFFLHTVAASGEKPIKFSAKGLPSSLRIEPSAGIIKGIAPAAGIYEVEITATDKNGATLQKIEIHIGEKLALSPPMGWNSWNVFTSDIDEKTVMEIADAMVSSGMRDAGYEYINIDDFWHADEREADGRPKADEKRFPRGIKFLSDYVHERGLKLGIYSCAATLTCGKRFGGYGYEAIDAKTYSDWGVDLLKYDYCYAPWDRKNAIKRYTEMGDALKQSGRSIVFSVCEWGIRKPWKWAAKSGGSYWRTTPDIFDKWKGNHPWQYGIIQILRHQKGLEKYAAPGAWNDPDMLIVGNYGKGNATSAKGKYKGLSDVQYESHFAIWCMLNAPLLASCDLRNMNDATKNILLNTRLIALNQDAAGKQASLVFKKNGLWIYKKELSDGVAYAFFNPTSKVQTKSIPVSIQKEMSGTMENILNGEELIKDYSQITLNKYQSIVVKVQR